MLKILTPAIGLVAMLLATVGIADAKPTAAQKCAAAVRLCCGKLFQKLTVCHAKAALAGTATGSASCADAALGKFDACGGAAVRKGGCLIDQAGIDHLKDEIQNSWAADVAADTPIE